MRYVMLVLAFLVAVAPSIVVAETVHPQAALFDKAANAVADVDYALARAATNGKIVIIVMGANWCYDSKGLAGWFETPRFVEMLNRKYEIIYVDVGTPQTGDGRNLDIAKRVGIKKVKHTPLVMLVSAGGKLLNSKKDAASWRNAASRSEDAIFGYFSAFTPG